MYLRLRSTLIVVENAEGFATEEPFLTVAVAFPVAIVDPVELVSAASEKTGVRSRAIQAETFIAGTRRNTMERVKIHVQLKFRT